MGNQQLTGCLSAPMEDGETYHTLSKSKSRSRSKSKRNTEPLSISTSTVHSVIAPSRSYPLSSTSHSTPSTDYKRNIKILFLDVDGVLNNKSLKWDTYNNGLDDCLLKYLKAIIIKTNCKIVLSTTWRLHRRAKQILIHSIKTRCDLNTDDLIIGETPDLKFCGKHRSDEIEEYLLSNAYHYNVISWCALDDISLHKFDAHSKQLMNGHFIKTNPQIGISPTNALNCIDILNTNDFNTNPYSFQRCYN